MTPEQIRQADAAMDAAPIPRSVRYGVSDVKTWQTACPVCDAPSGKDCWGLTGGGNVYLYQNGEKVMHAGRYKAAGRRNSPMGSVAHAHWVSPIEAAAEDRKGAAGQLWRRTCGRCGHDYANRGEKCPRCHLPDVDIPIALCGHDSTEAIAARHRKMADHNLKVLKASQQPQEVPASPTADPDSP